MKQRVSIRLLADRAAWLFGMTPDAMLAQSRRPRYARARDALALAARVSGRSYSQIGDFMRRDRTTIMAACANAEYYYSRDAVFRARCDQLLALVERGGGADFYDERTER